MAAPRLSTVRDLRASLLLLLAAAALGLLAVACSSSAEASRVREVLVDYNHDEFAGSFLANFPEHVSIRPGMTVRFEQAWTGEPHTVTGGTMVDEVMGEIAPLLDRYRGTPLDEIPPDDFQKVDELSMQLPYMLGEDPGALVNQNVAQPCFLAEGGPPEDPATPCADEDQAQPDFDGTQSWYNSGFIPYEGEQSNTFEVTFADDVDPGTYYFYCAVHGFLQNSRIEVVASDADIPSQADVAKAAREEIQKYAAPLLDSYELFRGDDSVSLTDPFSGQEAEFRAPYAGFATPDPWVHAFGSEFLPGEIRTRAGEPVTWSFVGGHTVSFQVPAYFSQMTVEDDGTVIFNPDAVQPVNGPGYPEHEEPEGGDGEDGGEPPPGEGQGEGEDGEGEEMPPPPAVDAGEWGGSEFLSSGVFWDGTYTVTFSEPGTYRYACLIHPRMVGAVVVDA